MNQMTRETDSTHWAPTIEKQNEKHSTHCCGYEGLWGKVSDILLDPEIH